MNRPRIGLAVCGSFCTYEKTMAAAVRICEKYDVTPIMSENSAGIDSRFGKAEDFKRMLEDYTGKNVIESIKAAEPIGPGKLLDLLVIAPCTGNTLAKIACGITDTSVTMACKAHLRNDRPVLIAVSTNDGLGANAVNIGSLLNRKNIYFVPFYQDDPLGKPTSLLSDFELLEESIEAALGGRQLQPVIKR